MVKPAVFVPKSERDTVHERERREAEERAVEELLRKKLEERKLETKQIVAEKIRDEEIITQKTLELEANILLLIGKARIKRKDVEDAILKEVQKEIEMLRNMTEEERKEWERRNPKPSPPPPKKKKSKFMQKYYHKGAFFQSDPDD
ncbi:hypothetical protein A4A49_54611 [Nicotiana attenuata]|uniref:Micro-fibrillar-associated protein 1 C-terminal domain-containing protein n=1 Tax=Nicotiana attenuata TaxID=49451 RepID=A0A314KJN8_NICAT|nr:hypothetical protein A4A49_54611 [Nicotiana attenuata]